MSKRNKPDKFVDDGRTVYDMSGLADMHNTGPKREKKQSVPVSKKERRALIRAAFATYTPIFLGVLASFTVAALLLYFWLK